ncbi:MAG: glycerol acyltransferase [Desulfotalea sp.]|nr:MAG: glycerol acyltransferase [Desulfotalea sp.]
MVTYFSKIILQLFGWKTVSNPRHNSHFVLIGAPHTSNWDFPLTLLALWALGIKFSWVAKDTLFVGPLGYIFKKMGGIPVDRKTRTVFLKSMINAFAENDNLILAIAPEGTRSKTDHWKAGFYNIAIQANVDICLAFVDYPSKTFGLGPMLHPSGDVKKDFVIIHDFYIDKTGKFPENQSTITLRDREIAILQREVNRSAKSTATSPSPK